MATEAAAGDAKNIGQVRLAAVTQEELDNKVSRLRAACKLRNCEVKEVEILQDGENGLLAAIHIGPAAETLSMDELVKRKFGDRKPVLLSLNKDGEVVKYFDVDTEDFGSQVTLMTNTPENEEWKSRCEALEEELEQARVIHGGGGSGNEEVVELRAQVAALQDQLVAQQGENQRVTSSQHGEVAELHAHVSELQVQLAKQRETQQAETAANKASAQEVLQLKAEIAQQQDETQKKDQWIGEQLDRVLRVVLSWTSQEGHADLPADPVALFAELENAVHKLVQRATLLKQTTDEEREKLTQAKHDAEKSADEARTAARNEVEVMRRTLETSRNAFGNILTQTKELLGGFHAEVDDLRAQVRDWQRSVSQDLFTTLTVVTDFVQWIAPVLNGEAPEADSPRLQRLGGAALNGAYRKMIEQCRTLQLQNRRMHNEVQDLKGSIRVYCRVRPLSKAEKNSGSVFKLRDGICISVFRGEDDRSKDYVFDRAFSPEETQLDVFAETEPLVQSALDGYNVCVFAYGQTGSGKTHTIMGTFDERERGLTFRALATLMKARDEQRSSMEISLELSMFEIYNEKLKDMLAPPSDDAKPLKVMGDPGDCIKIGGLSSTVVQNWEAGAALLEQGARERATTSTKMNDQSSRSHMLVLFKISCADLVEKTRWASKMYLIDLAGSEDVSKSGATGAALREAANINKSLSALQDVMGALAAERGHIPFRNSKLTHVLSDSLGGQAKTLMYVMVSPSPLQTRESTATLNFATRCKSIVLGPATKAARLQEGEQAGGGQRRKQAPAPSPAPTDETAAENDALTTRFRKQLQMFDK